MHRVAEVCIRRLLIAGNNLLDGPSFTSTTLNPSNDSSTLEPDADYLLREWIKNNFPVDHQAVLDGALDLVSTVRISRTTTEGPGRSSTMSFLHGEIVS